jgi:hypothetical protein
MIKYQKFKSKGQRMFKLWLPQTVPLAQQDRLEYVQWVISLAAPGNVPVILLTPSLIYRQ